MLVFGTCFALTEVGRACGDKFLIFGGPGFSRVDYASSYPSKVLVVKRPGELAVNSSKLISSLDRAGHKVKVIDSHAGLANALAEGKYDAVLVDLADAKASASPVASAAGQPLLVTVLSEPTAAELAASQEFACLRTPEKATTVMKLLDDFLAERKTARRRSQ